jgi:hypothetical protein
MTAKMVSECQVLLIMPDFVTEMTAKMVSECQVLLIMPDFVTEMTANRLRRGSYRPWIVSSAGVVCWALWNTGRGLLRLWGDARALECWFALALTFSLPLCDVRRFALIARPALSLPLPLPLNASLPLPFPLSCPPGLVCVTAVAYVS